MKKFFTLLAAAFICSSSAVFAQDDEPGDDPGEPQFVSFWCHEFRDPEVGAAQFDGPAEIVEDPTNPSNHCAKVHVRSEEVARAAENIIEADGALAGWDSQFFVYSKTAFQEGQEIKLVMRVRAEFETEGETTASVGTQAHDGPGNYNHWACVGNVEFTTEWKKIELSANVTADMTQAANGKEFHSIALNLADYKKGMTVYFDDVKLYVRDPNQQPPSPDTGWFNLLPQGTETDFTFGNYHTFTGRDGEIGTDLPARVVADPLDGEPALNVSGVCYNAIEEVPIIDDETGEPFLDDDGNPEVEIKQIWIKENGDTVRNIDDWQTQFFVTVPHVFATGQQFKLRMWARADKPSQIDTQIHTMPGDYIHWSFVGSIDLTTEWTLFEFGEEEVDQIRTIPSEGNGGQTIAFNCNKNKDEVVNYYFRFEEFDFNNGDVTIDERTLGKEDINVAIPEPGEEPAITNVDFTTCMETLGVEDIAELIESGCMTVQRVPVQTSEEEQGEEAAGWENVIPDGNMEPGETTDPGEDDDDPNMEVQYEEQLEAASGFSFNNKGLYTDEGELQFEVPEGYTADAVPFNIYNTSEDSYKGKSIDGAFYFVNQDGWNYRFNITFKGEPSDAIKGDVNGDGKVDISDVVAIINQMAGTAEWPNADVNGDDKVDISDVVNVINIMAGQSDAAEE